VREYREAISLQTRRAPSGATSLLNVRRPAPNTEAVAALAARRDTPGQLFLQACRLAARERPPGAISMYCHLFGGSIP